jgi:hypothetical protein
MFLWTSAPAFSLCVFSFGAAGFSLHLLQPIG